MLNSITSILCSISMLFSAGTAVVLTPDPALSENLPTVITQEYEQDIAEEFAVNAVSTTKTRGTISWKYDNDDSKTYVFN